MVSRFYSPNPFDVLNPGNNRIGDSNSVPTITPHFQVVWSSLAAEADNRPWQQQRKRTKIQASSLNTPPQPVTRTCQTVLLRPAERFAVSEIPHGALQDGVMAIGGPQTQDYRIRIQPDANLIAIDAWNPFLILRFLGLTTIQDGVGHFAFRPYEATPPDHARGIFHGFNVKDDGPTLLAQIVCRTHKPVAARPLDSQGRSVFVTFAGPTLPRFITYRPHHKQINPFRPKATVCTRCHLLGHTHDVCPTETPCCSTCGRPPNRVQIDGCHEPPIYRNCQGPYIATDNSCPLKKQLTKQRRSQHKTGELSTTLYMRLNQPPRWTLPGSLGNLPVRGMSSQTPELHSEISPENGRCLTASKKPDVPPHVLCSLLTPRQSPTNISTSGRPGKKPKISTSPAAKQWLTEFALTAQLPTQPNMPTDWLVKICSGIVKHLTATQEPAAFGAPSEDYPSAPAFAQQEKT
ncbi:hypothetical protein HPB49_004168 [Dermacentor silvarum]|uniref:Uncharacterized protein n=1 Tax=Dermacentor silvarum TaxID=543639 RepID=A0ACB8CPQ4_DERSI|nr:hypothetical protein HPB49_004168 [Dermacentor silvarum]